MTRVQSWGPGSRPSGIKVSQRSRLLAICSLCGAVCLTAMIVSGMAEDVMSGARRMRMRARDMRLQALGITPLTGGKRGEREEREGGQMVPGRGGVDQDLSIEAARAILDAPERAQESLILKPDSVKEEYRQGKLLQQLIVDSDKHVNNRLHDDHQDETHVTTPGQQRSERQWSLIFVTAIATASVTFETLKEMAMENTPPTMIKVVEKFFGELATLGFIGTIAFVLTTDFGATESMLGQLSFRYTGDSEMLIHEFEVLHFLIFFVMVFFVTAVLVVLQLTIGQRAKWLLFRERFDAMLKDRKTTAEDIFELMRVPETAPGVEGTMSHEYFKSDSIRQAEFLRFRQRFVNDAGCPVRIPEDFNFAYYMTLCISRTLEQVVEVGVYDWVSLWFIYLVLYLILASTDYVARGGDMDGKNTSADAFALIVMFCCFFLVQVIIMFSSFVIFRMLAFQYSLLLPGLPDTPEKVYKVKSPEPNSNATDGMWEGDESRRRDVKLLEPRYISEMKVVVKDRSWLTQVMDFVRGRKDHPSKHEQIFGFLGSSGPSVVISCIKLILLGSIVSIAALATVLFPLLYELSPVLPFLAILPPCVSIYQIPKMVTLYTWVCYTEMLKNSEDIISVVRTQKQEKLINILRILSMLSYFLDQVQFLKQVAKDGGDISTEAVSDEKWEKIQEETDQAILDDLKNLFDAFDDDESGELDEDEVGALIAQMGTPLSKEEVAGLFRIMDADASGAVDFREFATVVLHQKKQQGGKVNFSELAEKMFAIFDHTGDGVISEEEILTQMESMGKNWDRDSIKYFLNEVDKDGSGEIEKQEFIEYMAKIQNEVSL